MIFRKTGKLLPESGSESSSSAEADTVPESPNKGSTVPKSTAHMIGWTLSKEVKKLELALDVLRKIATDGFKIATSVTVGL